MEFYTVKVSLQNLLLYDFKTSQDEKCYYHAPMRCQKREYFTKGAWFIRSNQFGQVGYSHVTTLTYTVHSKDITFTRDITL